MESNKEYNESVSVVNDNEVFISEQKDSASIISFMIVHFNKVLAAIAGLSIVLMMLLIVANSIIRVFGDPFSGTTEVVGWLSAISTSFALGYTQIQRGHVDIDLLVEKFPPVVQRLFQSIIYLISICFFLILGWQIVLYGNSLMQSGILSGTLKLIFYPFVYMVAIGFLGLTLALLLDLIKNIKGGD